MKFLINIVIMTISVFIYAWSGSFIEKHEIIKEPAWFTFYGVVWGVIGYVLWLMLQEWLDYKYPKTRKE